MIRVGISPLIILVNNAGYTIEEEIHQGPYNKISDWNYTAVVEGMAGQRKNLYTAKVRCCTLGVYETCHCEAKHRTWLQGLCL